MTPNEKAKTDILAALPDSLEELVKSMRFAPSFVTSEGLAVGSMRLNGRDVQVQLKLEADPEEFMLTPEERAALKSRLKSEDDDAPAPHKK
jgi:hypothetical protein